MVTKQLWELCRWKNNLKDMRAVLSIVRAISKKIGMQDCTCRLVDSYLVLFSVETLSFKAFSFQDKAKACLQTMSSFK